MYNIDLIALGVSLVGIPYFSWKRKWNIVLGCVLLLWGSGLGVLIGINIPNPDNIILIAVTTP